MNLPIDIVANSKPPRFKWQQVVDTPLGPKTVDYEGTLPPSVEGAVAQLISVSKQLMVENAELKQAARLPSFVESTAKAYELPAKVLHDIQQPMPEVRKSKDKR